MMTEIAYGGLTHEDVALIEACQEERDRLQAEINALNSEINNKRADIRELSIKNLAQKFGVKDWAVRRAMSGNA